MPSVPGSVNGAPGCARLLESDGIVVDAGVCLKLLLESETAAGEAPRVPVELQPGTLDEADGAWAGYGDSGACVCYIERRHSKTREHKLEMAFGVGGEAPHHIRCGTLNTTGRGSAAAASAGAESGTEKRRHRWTRVSCGLFGRRHHPAILRERRFGRGTSDARAERGG